VAGQCVSTEIGTVNAKTPTGTKSIENVWIVKKGKYSLAAVSVIAKELNLNLMFDDKGVYILKHVSNEKYEKVKQIGGLRNGLYYVYNNFILKQQPTSKVKAFNGFMVKNKVLYKENREQLQHGKVGTQRQCGKRFSVQFTRSK
jgi:hypothetical protein